MTNVVEFGEFKVTLERRKLYGKQCKHMNITLDANGEFVKCDDCHETISAWYALQTLVEWWDVAEKNLAAKQVRQQEVESKTIHLKAAQRVEAAWRSRSMVPTCPHCREAIFPEDGFGGSATNREIAVRRRQKLSVVKP
jgi:hypothetical protein